MNAAFKFQMLTLSISLGFSSLAVAQTATGAMGALSQLNAAAAQSPSGSDEEASVAAGAAFENAGAEEAELADAGKSEKPKESRFSKLKKALSPKPAAKPKKVEGTVSQEAGAEPAQEINADPNKNGNIIIQLQQNQNAGSDGKKKYGGLSSFLIGGLIGLGLSWAGVAGGPFTLFLVGGLAGWGVSLWNNQG